MLDRRLGSLHHLGWVFFVGGGGCTGGFAALTSPRRPSARRDDHAIGGRGRQLHRLVVIRTPRDEGERRCGDTVHLRQQRAQVSSPGSGTGGQTIPNCFNFPRRGVAWGGAPAVRCAVVQASLGGVEAPGVKGGDRHLGSTLRRAPEPTVSLQAAEAPLSRYCVEALLAAVGTWVAVLGGASRHFQQLKHRLDPPPKPAGRGAPALCR